MCSRLWIQGAYLQQDAGAIYLGFPQQLAVKVKVGLGLDAGQVDPGGRGEKVLLGGPGTELIHGPLVLRLKVERLAGGPGNHGALRTPVEGHHREAKGVQQIDGAAKRLSLATSWMNWGTRRNKRRDNEEEDELEKKEEQEKER